MPTTTSNDHRTTTEVTKRALSVDISVITQIDAPASTVWSVLANTAGYEDWNPLITTFDGSVAVGKKVSVMLALPDRKPQRISPRIVELTPGRSFTWLGSIGVRGLFDGRHHFEVEPVTADTCRFVHREHLAGMLVPMFSTMLTVNTPAAFLAMNEALARHVTDCG